MNKKVFVLLASLTVSAFAEDFLQDRDKYRTLCYIYGKYSFYDLRSMEKTDQDYLLRRTTYTDAAETIEDDQYTYAFNFCQPARRHCNDDGTAAEDGYEVWAYHIEEDMASGTTSCIEYSSTDLMSSFDAEVLYNEETHEKHVQIEFSGGDACPADHSDYYSYVIDIKCNPEAVDPIAAGIVVEDDCHPKLLYEAAAGCPVVNLSSWAIYLGEHPIIAAIILIVLGGFTCLKGKKFFDIVVGLIGLLIGFGGAMLIFSAYGMVDYLDPFAVEEESLGMAILAFVLSLVIGLIVGALLYKFAIAVGLYFLAIFVGLFIGVLVYNTFLNYLDNIWIFLTCSIGGAIVVLVLACLFHDFILILSTSFIGAYFCIRGVSMIFGGYPSELEMYQAYSNGIKLDFEYTFYIYLICIGVLFLIGFCLQNKEKDEEENKEGYQAMTN